MSSQKRGFGHRINNWLDEPEGETFKSGKWRFWFPMLIGFAVLNAALTAMIFGSGGAMQTYMGAIMLSIGALLAWLCIGTLHYSDSRDAKMSRGVAALDSVTLIFVIAHFSFLLWIQGHVWTLQARETEYKAVATAYNEKAEKISSDNVKIAEAGAQAAREVTKAARLENDTAYQLRRTAEAGHIQRPRAGRSLAGQSPTLVTSPIELEKPEKPKQSSADFLTYWDFWVRLANFGELALAAITFIYIRNRSVKFNAQARRDDEIFPSEIDMDVRSPHYQPRFDREASYARNIASQEAGEASQDGLKALQEICSAISFHTPGQWFAVDERGDHVRIRLRTRVDGREMTLKTARLRSDVLIDAVRMPRNQFRARVERSLRRGGFEL